MRLNNEKSGFRDDSNYYLPSSFFGQLEIDSKFSLTGIPGEYVYQSSEIYRAQKSFSDDARKWYPGFQGGFGLQFNLSPRQALVIESDFRLARATGFRGVGYHQIRYKHQNDIEWESSDATLRGQLFYVPISYINGKPLNLIAVDDPGFVMPGKIASLNINGIVLKAGLRFKL